MGKKIDCHTHIVNDKIAEEYFYKTHGYAVVMDFIDKFSGNAPPTTALETAMANSHLFYCPAIDIGEEILPQLEKIEALLPNEKIVGIKIYLTYQKGRADDSKMMPIYDFAVKYGLTITYHTGSCSLVLPTDNDMDGSNAKYVQNVAKHYPNVNFVVAHMDDPRFNECIKIVHETPNMFTDFSGAYEPGTKEGGDIEWAINTFAEAINQYPDTYKKILYGTDFCPPINLSAIEEYDYTISKIFPKEQRSAVYFENCLCAFPRIREFFERNNYE